MGMQFLSVSDRNKPGVTSQKPVEFIQQKTLLALVSSLGIYQRSSSDIGAAQGKERGTGLLLSCDSGWALLSHRRLF